LDDLHKNPLIDLFLILENEEQLPETKYLQHVSHPQEVTIFTPDFLVAAKKEEASNRKDLLTT
jgi:hypothetical protein